LGDEVDPLFNYTEEGVEKVIHLDYSKMEDCDAKRFVEASKVIKRVDFPRWIEEHKKGFSSTTFVADTDKPEVFEQFGDGTLSYICAVPLLNMIRHLDTYLNCASEALEKGGFLTCHARTALLKKEMIFNKYPSPLAEIIYSFHYIWSRVFPKLLFFRKIYFGVTNGRNRTFHRVEIMGRICRAGFDIVEIGFRDGDFCVLAQKVRDPIWNDNPSCGPLIKLNRVGYKGKMIGVYKLRTMYSYSEYLQPYMLTHEGLREGGKFANDYRVNSWGNLFRKTWIDEIPMLLNVLIGQMKLVGVRPLSKHYFSLYSPEMQELHIKVKPGLLPPFYYEKNTPKTIEEVQESERRYIESYLKAPLRTDWRYFWGTMRNILVKKKRSH